MANVIKLRKGLNINLKGKAARQKFSSGKCAQYALVPDDFVGMTPKVVVREGDTVKVGDALFVNKKQTDVKFASPVSGVVSAVVRGDRRKVLRVVVDADKEQQYVDFGQKQVASLDGDAVVKALLDAGLFGYINQLPYAVSTTPDQKPRAIFVSALRDMPLAGDFEYELEGNEHDFQTGLSALAKVAKTYLGIGVQQTNAALTGAKDVEVTVFDGACPAGNVGVQVNNIAPVNKGEVVWTVDPTAVIFFGRLFNTGKVDLRRLVAVAGSEITAPAYTEALVGQPIASILDGKLAVKKNHVRIINGNGIYANSVEEYDVKNHVRIINGNPLTGRKCTAEDFVGGHTSEITVIPEGDDVDEMLGWILPRTNDFSVSRSYFSWLFGKKKEYSLDARVKGGERHMIMSGEYDKVLPMDIYGEYLIKAIIAGDIDRMEQLGIYEVAPEDFALAEFVDSSKLELQHIVRQGLDMLRKENA